MEKAIYKRILLKISGEALAGNNHSGFDRESINKVVDELVKINNMGVEVGIVVGGGNFWRGRQGNEIERTTADYMGMLATVINALALQDAIEQRGVETRVMTALSIDRIGEPYNTRKAVGYLKENKIVIFGCGTGNPYFSTDTGAALRAAEIKADVLLLAKNIDGVYDSDPKLNPDAKKFSELKYMEFISKGLKAMDTSSVTLCMENNIKIFVFGLGEENSISDAVTGKSNGTVIG